MNAEAEPEPQWYFAFLDSSRVLTVVISILLIVYGSFRAVGADKINDEGEEKVGDGSNTVFSGLLDGFHSISAAQAVFLPVGASFSLLVMFFFFDTLQFFFALCTSVLATVAFSFLMLPVCQFVIRPFVGSARINQRISLGACGIFTIAEIISLCCSTSLVLVWIVTGNWVLMDALAMGLCVSIIAYIRLPSLKVSTLLLTGLLVYDVFWVFFSAYIFKANVMVQVATRQALNPVAFVADKFKFGTHANVAPRISLPGKLIFPSFQERGRYSMLGLGDIFNADFPAGFDMFLISRCIMPGLLLCFVMRYDNYKRQLSQLPDNEQSKVTYFHCSLIGYIVGLVTATVASEVYKAAQPALLYLVPFTLLPVMVMAYFKGDLRKMWQDPFLAVAAKLKFEEV